MFKKNKNKKNEKDKKEEPKIAKDFVNLTHVETKKQKVDYKGMVDILSQKEAYDEQQQFRKKLTTDEQAIMTSFQKKRMLLDRIWIITNQSRIQMGLDGYKRENLKKILDNLVDMGYLTYEAVQYESKFNDVYILTELGKEQVF
ncbi:MAG: hypothetical protein ACTSRX_09785 [Promethearchaeota archaeon]